MTGLYGGLDAIATPQIIIISILVVFLVPILLHFVTFRAKPVAVPIFMAVGPRDAGKTTLSIYLQNGSTSDTQTSTTPSSGIFTLKSPSSDINDNDDDEETDDHNHDHDHQPKRKLKLMDTPGHPKLRSTTFDYISETPNHLNGIIFLLDSAGIQTPSVLNDTVTYLYDILLAVQKRCMASTGSINAAKGSAIPVLIACNKNDLFTALPASKIGKILEKELEGLRDTKGRGVMDVGKDEGAEVEEGDVLGEDDGREFSWGMMEDVGVTVTLKGGSVKGGKIEEWERWIAEALE